MRSVRRGRANEECYGARSEIVSVTSCHDATLHSRTNRVSDLVLERPRLSRLRPSLRVRRRCVGERPFTITCAIFIGGAPICNRGKPSAHPDEPPVDEGQSVSSAPPAVVWLTRTPPNSRREIWCTTVLWAVDQEKRVGDGRRTNETA